MARGTYKGLLQPDDPRVGQCIVFTQMSPKLMAHLRKLSAEAAAAREEDAKNANKPPRK
jgi:hypothetical protein